MKKTNKQNSEVLVITSNYPPEIGGPAKFTFDFVKWVQQKNIITKVITTSPNRKKMNSNQILFVSRKSNILMRVITTVFYIFKTRKTNRILVVGLFYEVLIAKLIFKFEYVAKVPSDIVWDRARNNKKTSLDINEFQTAHSYIYNFQRWIFTKSLNYSKTVIVPSNHLKELVKSWGILEQKILVIRNSNELHERVEQINYTYDLIYVGRLIELKNLPEVFFICKSMNLSILILGSGPQLNELKKLATDLKISATFKGNVSYSEVVQNLKMAKVFILNSLHEGSPNALIEAQSLGCVCVVRANHGTLEIVNDLVNGVLVSEKRSLSDAIKLSLNDQLLRQNLSINSIKFAQENFDRDKNYEKILNLLI